MEVPLTSLQAIFERAAFGVGQVSPAGDRQFLNDRFCEIVGYSREELFASSERDILMPMIALRQTKSYGGSWQVRFRRPHWRTAMSRNDGTIVCAELCVSLLRDHD